MATRASASAREGARPHGALLPKSAAGAELAGKFDLLRAAPAALMAELDKVEPDYSITMADLPGDAAAQIDATMRSFLAAERNEVGSGRRLAEDLHADVALPTHRCTPLASVLPAPLLSGNRPYCPR